MKPTKQRYRPLYNEGTCKQLKGKIGVVFFYLNDRESQWTQNDIESMKPYLQEMQDFIANSAKQYQTYAQFTALHIHTNQQQNPLSYPYIVCPYSDINQQQGAFDVLHCISISLGYQSVQNMHQDMQQRTGCQQVAYQIILNKAGRAYALITDETQEYTEHAIIFRKSAKSGQIRNAGIYAHEFLHLFGAEDLYHTKYRKAHAALYHNDVMYTTRYDIQHTTISNITAYSLGWHNNLPEILKAKRWWQ